MRPRHVSDESEAIAAPTAVGAGQQLPSSIEGREAGGSSSLKKRRNNMEKAPSSPLKEGNNWSGRGVLRRQRLDSRRWRTWMPRRRRLAMCSLCAGGSLFACASLFVSCRMMAMAKIASFASSPHAHQLVSNDEQVWGDFFTILVNTFQRPKQLEGALRHYAACARVESVRVAWSEPSAPPNQVENPRLFAHPRPVMFHSYPTSSINNRFIPPSNLRTDAVFVVDDDIVVPCEHLEAAFQTWQRHPDTLVGFFPRSHAHRASRKQETGSKLWEYLYFWRVLWNMEYSIILTKAAFVHAKYLEMYSGTAGEGGTDYNSNPAMVETMTQSRAYVDSHRNCEDIAMQMAVTSVSGLPPVAVFAPVVDKGLFGGISTEEGSGKWWQAPHAMKRSRCLADLHEIFCGTLGRASALSIDEFPLATATPAAESPPSCGAGQLVGTSLFAGEPPTRASLRGGSERYPRTEIDERKGSDLSTLSRWGLAVRAPTLAEFISADMVLIPGKVWRWLVEEDILGRPTE